MRQIYCLFTAGLSKVSTLLLLSLLLQSCSIFESPVKQVKLQTGQHLQAQTSLYSLTSIESIAAFIQKYEFESEKLSELAKTNKNEISSLIRNANRLQSVSRAVTETAKSYPQKVDIIVQLALMLYPVDQYRIVDTLIESSDISEQNIKEGALLAGLDPNNLYDATASETESYRIVPLINSASVTLFNQPEDTKSELFFKHPDQQLWQKGLALQWEPVRGALSGSIVRLTADTQYQVKLSLTNRYGEIEIKEFTFSTRPNSPPIDPNKIYKLSDIYSGGQLDLETLNIEGNENGWAKIIGDQDTIVEAFPDDMSAIHFGSQNYIMLENITVKGGWRYGIHSYKAHHIWIKGCDVSQWGRVASEYREGKGFHKPDSNVPINYDAGIYLERSGVAVIEDCEIHSPNGQANHWGVGHPNGPNALQVVAHHPTEKFRGQFIVRNNRFYGTSEKRFNDVVEGRYNTKAYGGFGRDSAIYGNYFAYANDDLIEIDGGQSNVLVYDNELTQGYCGISAAPNRIGPSYIFNNYIHNLGDERGKEWGAIKLGGLLSAPAGLTNIFENIIVTNRNGVVSASVKGDKTFWANVRNNTIVTKRYSNLVGLGIYDSERYENSNYENNFIYNTVVESPIFDAIERESFLHPLSNKLNFPVEDIDERFKLPIEDKFIIDNFSENTIGNLPVIQDAEKETDYIEVQIDQLGGFARQDKFSNVVAIPQGIQITGNSWKKMPLSYEITSNTVFKFNVEVVGDAEIVGFAFENNNTLSRKRSFKVTGSQKWGIRDVKREQSEQGTAFTLPVGQYMPGRIDKIVFIVDADNATLENAPTVRFTKLRFEEH